MNPKMMDTLRRTNAWRPLLATILLCTIGVAAMAQTKNQEEPAKEADKVIELSPFVVSTEKDTGYQATSSLAGTRLNTPLRDIAASVSVLTKDLFEDTGSTKPAEFLVYATGTEIAGVGGNYSGGADNGVGERRRVIPVNRIRGLAEADYTRNYFATALPIDTYNLSSVTINRGANAILFGLGSPAGIIESSTLKPLFRNATTVQLRTDNYGSLRESLDFERVLKDGKLSLRVAALDEHQKFEQEEAFHDQRRIYGTAEFRPYKNTVVRVNAEKGTSKQRLPRLEPPIDTMQVWWAYGKLTRPDNIWPKPFGLSEPSQAFERLNALDGAFGLYFYSPAAFFSSGGGSPTDAFPSFSDVPDPTNDPNNVQYRFLGLRDVQGSSFYATRSFSTPGNPLFFFNHNPQILDRSTFDYRKHMIDGVNSHTNMDFHAFNASVEQLFLDGDAGIELTYDQQHSIQDLLDTVPWAVNLDVNQQTIDGRANPNFGRPYLAANQTANLSEVDNVNARATAFLKHDFSRSMGWLGKALGKQQVTGFYTDWNSKTFSINAAPAVFDTSYYVGTSNSIGSRTIAPIVYLGPSLLTASSAAGANLQPAGQLIYPTSLTVQVLNPSSNYVWQSQTHAIYQYPDWRMTATGVNASRSQVDSSGAVWQGNWWDGLLVSTLGWRRDEVDQYNGDNNSSYDPVTGARLINLPHVKLSQAAKSSLFSQGYALHLPQNWTARLPGKLNLSLYANRSENFQVTGFRQTVFAEPIGPQSGTTKEWGFGVEALNGRLSLRVTKFETTQDNQTDGRLGGILGSVAELERRVYETNTPAALDAAGYVSFLNANASAILKKYAAAWRLTDAGPLVNGGRQITYVAPAGVSEITSSVSKGWEYELTFNPTRNWRILLNASEATAARGAAGLTLKDLIDERKQYWLKDSVKGLQAGQNYTVGDYANTVIINAYNTALLSVGQLNPELAKWHANVVTNYQFDHASRFKGWSVGGAWRWEDKTAIGYAVIKDPVLGVLSDPRHPFYGPAQKFVDLSVGYTRKVYNNRIDWKIQLNVRNALNSNTLIPLQSNAVAVDNLKDYTIGTYRIGEGRSYILTSSFSW